MAFKINKWANIINDHQGYTSFTNDTYLYVCRQNFFEAINYLQPKINKTFTWFYQHGFVANSGESHFLVRPYEKINIDVLDTSAESTVSEKSLGNAIDIELIFNDHIT